ncbi:MAG: FeoB-associated Cys-rich membrane protein [Candidatus Sericytochromatia bacterium]
MAVTFESALLENLVILGVLMLSSGYIFRRLQRMSQAHKRKQSACGDCASGTCAPVKPQQAEKGETPLPLR